MQNTGYAETGAGVVVAPNGEQYAHWRAAYEIMSARLALTTAAREGDGGTSDGGSGGDTGNVVDLTVATPPRAAADGTVAVADSVSNSRRRYVLYESHSPP